MTVKKVDREIGWLPHLRACVVFFTVLNTDLCINLLSHVHATNWYRDLWFQIFLKENWYVEYCYKRNISEKNLVISLVVEKVRMFCFSKCRRVLSTRTRSVKVNLFPGQPFSCHTRHSYGHSLCMDNGAMKPTVMYYTTCHFPRKISDYLKFNIKKRCIDAFHRLVMYEMKYRNLKTKTGAAWLKLFAMTKIFNSARGSLLLSIIRTRISY